MTTFTNDEMNRRSTALLASATLVSNPVHAFAANPQNVMNLADVFYSFIEGKDLPVNSLTETVPMVKTDDNTVAAANDTDELVATAKFA